LSDSAVGWFYVQEQAGLPRRGGELIFDIAVPSAPPLLRESLIRKSQAFFHLYKFPLFVSYRLPSV
ncbi:hypothetical protein, partial [Photobacterium damselae]|uniref:hypothetical protein n=1 Tax=Photobacterium damselae TaxID=38293 RepID=UPI001A8FEFA0